jgi:ABC-type Mn2+/Zn2+ transport system permease subunit
MFTEPFMQRALLAAALLGPLCALLGVFVTARRLAFFSDTISHGALTGIALGFWFGIAEPTWPMLVFSLASAAFILWLKEKTPLAMDTIMALILSGSVATGVIILARLQTSPGKLHQYLFGDILLIDSSDVWLAAAVTVAVGVWYFSQLSALALITAQEDMAHVCGIKVRFLNYAFVFVLAIVVALTIRLLGIILVTSLLVIPAAAARNLSCNLRQQVSFSVIAGFGGAVGGTLLAYQFSVPCGAAIVMTSIGLFMLTLAVRLIFGARLFGRVSG